MGSRLINVRLDPDRVRKARRLRETGVALSVVVRAAIDAQFDALQQPLTGREAVARIEDILARHPDQRRVSPRPYDVHHGRAARSAITAALARRR